MSNKIELLSPVGSFESLHAAIQAGADSIYFGIEQLNMRTRSSKPFTINDIAEISTTCKQNNIKCYITLNTVMYQHDLSLLQNILEEVKKQKVNAVIASDFAVIEKCKKLNIPLHISTQANVSNIEAVKFFASYSDVVVLARELTLQQIHSIHTEIIRQNILGASGKQIKLEAFIHGALCMAISGKCYLSLHEFNASANRGACMQNCRRSYIVTDKETGYQLEIDNEYIMSPKDLCTISILDKIIQSGVRVLKIEGRSKGPEYVYHSTKCYKEAIISIENKNFTQEKINNWLTELRTVYNRGFWEGYYLGNQLGEWATEPGSIATQKKIYVAKGIKYYPKIKVAEFKIETGTIKQGDSILLTNNQWGIKEITLNEFEVNGLKNTQAQKGDSITFILPEKINKETKLYKIIST